MTNMTLTPPRSLGHWLRIYRLYMASFPAPERKPFSIIVKAFRRGTTDIWCFEDRGDFLGFAITMNGKALIMLDYFAVEKKHRGEGIGTAALKQVLSHYAGKGVFLEIESVYEPGEDQPKRQKRKDFYLHCGLKPLNVMVNLFGVPMELLGVNCQMDYETYRNFYRDNYRKMALKHISKLTHPNEEQQEA